MPNDDPTAEKPASEIPSSTSARAEERATAKVRRMKRIERREACYGFFVSGYTHHEIAKATKASVATVRRQIDQAIGERRLQAPEHHARVQVTRLDKALCALDNQLERGDTRAVGPMIKVLFALDRYHGLRGGYARLTSEPVTLPAIEAKPRLALTHAGSADAASPLFATNTKVAENGAQALDIGSTNRIAPEETDESGADALLEVE